jgi:hypothetical protein
MRIQSEAAVLAGQVLKRCINPCKPSDHFGNPVFCSRSGLSCPQGRYRVPPLGTIKKGKTIPVTGRGGP